MIASANANETRVGSANNVHANWYNGPSYASVTAAVGSVSPAAAAGFLPLFGLGFPHTTFVRFPCTSSPPCTLNASAALSAMSRLPNMTNAQ